LSSLSTVDAGIRVIIVDLRQVPTIDATALVGLKSLIGDMRRAGISLIFAGLTARQLVKLRRAGIRKQAGELTYSSDLDKALAVARRWLANMPADTRGGPHNAG